MLKSYIYPIIDIRFNLFKDFIQNIVFFTIKKSQNKYLIYNFELYQLDRDQGTVVEVVLSQSSFCRIPSF